MTITPHPSYEFGFVDGLFVKAVADRGPEDDADRKPDFIPATEVGVMFTPVVSARKIVDAPSMYVTKTPTVAVVAQDGRLRLRGQTSEPPGVGLIAGVYNVTFSGIRLSPIQIEVLPTHTEQNPLDLVTALPYEPAPNEVVLLVPLPTGGEPGQYLTPLTGGGHGWADAPSGEDGTTDHAELTNRDAADQHPIGAITGLQAELDGKSEAGHTHTPASIGAAPASHAHDDRYYTESEVDAALAGKADTSHQHPVTDLTATGTPSETTYLRGDGTWATPEGQGPSHESILASGNVTLPTEHPVLTIRADDPATLSLPEAPDGTVVTIHVAHGWENLTWGPGITVTGDSTTTETWVVLVRAEGEWKALVSGESGGGSGILTGYGNPNTLGVKASTMGVLYVDGWRTDGVDLWSAGYVDYDGNTQWRVVDGFAYKPIDEGGVMLNLSRFGGRVEADIFVELTGGGNGEEVTLPASTIDLGEVDEGFTGSPSISALALVTSPGIPSPVQLPPIMCVFTQFDRYVLHLPEVVIPAYTSPDPVRVMGTLELGAENAPWPVGGGGGGVV